MLVFGAFSPNKHIRGASSKKPTHFYLLPSLMCFTCLPTAQPPTLVPLMRSGFLPTWFNTQSGATYCCKFGYGLTQLVDAIVILLFFADRFPRKH